MPKVQDLAQAVDNDLDKSVINTATANKDFEVKPTTLLDTVKLDVEENEQSARNAKNLSLDQVEEEEGAFDIYFDTIF